MNHFKNTIYEIADKAGVSIATVSRALNPETAGKVSPDTLKHIREIALKYGYTPSLAARHLTSTAYKTIGIIFPHHTGIFKGDYYSRILAGAADAVVETDYQMKVMMLKCEKTYRDRYNFAAGEAVDGIIVTHWRAFFSSKTALEKLNVPVAIINDLDPDTNALFVSGDHEQGGRLSAEHFFKQGHRKVGVFTGSPDSQDSKLRLKGFRQFFKEKNIEIPVKAVACAHFQEEEAFKCTPDFIQKNPSVTAVFCCNDGMAFGFIRALKELGLNCPKDISVIGYDDDRRGESFTPPLTSVRVPLEDIAEEAAKKLIRHLKSPKDKLKAVLTGDILKPVTLVERKSVIPKK